MDLTNWDLILKNVIGKDREFENKFRRIIGRIREDRKSATEEQAKLDFSLLILN